MRLLPLAATYLFVTTLLAAGGLPAPAIVERYVSEAFAANLALQQKKFDADTACARLAAAHSLYYPQLDFEARYTLAEGGRTIDVPMGDLLNPVYRTLNDMLGATRFDDVRNESIPFTTRREQETKLRLLQPLYRPQISRGAAAARANVAGSQASLAAFKRELRLEVQRSYFRWLQAEAAIRVYSATNEVVEEAWRAARALVAAQTATEDVALRAEAEVMSVRQMQYSAVADRDLARSYFNFLLNRASDSTIEEAPEQELNDLMRAVGAVDSLAASPREELEAAKHAIDAASAAEQAVRANRQPGLTLAVESGILGESYRYGRGSRFTQASLLADWNIFDGRRISSQVREAGNERAKAEVQREEIRRQLEMQSGDARRRITAANAALTAASARRTAATRVFLLVSRRQSEGLVNQLGFLDARREHTAAQLGYAVARSQLLIAIVEFDRALALTPLP